MSRDHERTPRKYILKPMKKTCLINTINMDARSASKQQARGSKAYKTNSILLGVHPELETYKTRVTLLEEENKPLQRLRIQNPL